MIIKKLLDAGFDVQVLDAETLVASLDDSCDLPTGKDMTCFDDLLIFKFMEIPPRLYDDLEMMGIEQPVLVEVMPCGSWYFADGHHRLAWALVREKLVPVVFSTGEIDEFELYDILAENDIYYEYA